MGDTCGEKEKAHKEVVMAHKGSVLLFIFICESPFGGYVFICSKSSMQYFMKRAGSYVKMNSVCKYVVNAAPRTH